MIEINDNIDGYMNESFEDLINRLPRKHIIRHIRSIRTELQFKRLLSEERLKELSNRLEFCYKKLKCEKNE